MLQLSSHSFQDGETIPASLPLPYRMQITTLRCLLITIPTLPGATRPQGHSLLC